MKRALLFSVAPLSFLSCAKEPSNPVNPPSQLVGTTFVFGQEKATSLNHAIHFQPLPYQDTTNLQYLDLSEISDFGIRVTEEGAVFDPATFDRSKIVFHLLTKHDQEGFEGDVNCRFLGYGGSTDQKGAYLFFGVLVPVVVRPTIVSHDDTLQFTGTEDDFVIARYVSPYSGLTVMDTVIITKNI